MGFGSKSRFSDVPWGGWWGGVGGLWGEWGWRFKAQDKGSEPTSAKKAMRRKQIWGDVCSLSRHACPIEAALCISLEKKVVARVQLPLPCYYAALQTVAIVSLMQACQ